MKRILLTLWVSLSGPSPLMGEEGRIVNVSAEGVAPTPAGDWACSLDVMPGRRTLSRAGMAPHFQRAVASACRIAITSAPGRPIILDSGDVVSATVDLVAVVELEQARAIIAGLGK